MARKEDFALMQNHADGSDLRHKKHPCDGCYYFGGKQAYVKCCNYYLVTGNRRPCEAGEGCIVRKDGRRQRTAEKIGYS